MMKLITAVVLFLMFAGSVEASNISFSFKKNFLSRNYSLVILNRDEEEIVEFYGCYNYPPTETNYYAVMKNGYEYNFDSKAFCQVGKKGRIAVRPGGKGVIPFNIKREIMQDAEQIVFKGSVHASRENNPDGTPKDERILTVIYDVANNSISYEIGGPPSKSLQEELSNK